MADFQADEIALRCYRAPIDENERDDSPASYRLTRRRIVVGGTLIVGGLGLHSFTAATAAAAPGGAGATPFMALSRLLIDQHLDEQVGYRLAVAMTAMTPGLPRKIDSLLAIARARDARLVEDFFDDIDGGWLYPPFMRELVLTDSEIGLTETDLDRLSVALMLPR